LKRCASMELLNAVHEVLKGRTYVTPFDQERHLGQLPGAARVWGDLGELTDRQREVVQLVAEGHPVKEIAAILNISQKTVAFHKSNVMRRLGIRSTAEIDEIRSGTTASADPDQPWQWRQIRASLSRAKTGHLPSSAGLISKATIRSSASSGETSIERADQRSLSNAGADRSGPWQSVLCPLIGLDFERFSPRETGNCMRLPIAVELWPCCANQRVAVLLCERDHSDGNWEDLLKATARLPDPPNLIVFSRLADESLWGEGAESGRFRRADNAFRAGGGLASHLRRLEPLGMRLWCEHRQRGDW